MKKICSFALGLGLSWNMWADNTCEELGGKVTPMPMVFMSAQGENIQGFTKKFCLFEINQGIAVIGLGSMNSKKVNIAASYVKTLHPIDYNSPLWEGSASNPSHNVCHNLGGTTAQNVTLGAFKSENGEYDICVFGDGSMISAWTLIYIANQREGYDLIKNNIPSQALPLNR
jgi:hypothetical protein